MRPAGLWLRRLWAWFMLGLAFWRRQARRLIPGINDAGGVDRFLANYAPEGMAPLTAEDETLLQQLGACIHCGLCEAVCPAPADRAVAYTRATQYAAEAAASLAGCPPDCAACEAICPTGVPLAAIPAYFARRAAAQAAWPQAPGAVPDKV